METRVGLCLAALLFMSGMVKAQNDPCQNIQCASNEECKEMNGVVGCGCTTRPNPDSFDASETCSSSSVTVSLARCQLFEAGINVSSLHLNDPNCTGVIQNDRVLFSVDNSQNICGTTLRVGNVLFKEIQKESSFTVQMSAYPNDSFIDPYSGDVRLDLDQRIYVSVNVTGVDEQQVSTTLESCWATPSEDSHDATRWDLIINDCPNLADGTVSVLMNGVSTSAQFSFKMFTFTSVSQKIFLHCHVQMCLKNKGNCQQSCLTQAKRRRRSLNYGEPVAISMTF